MGVSLRKGFAEDDRRTLSATLAMAFDDRGCSAVPVRFALVTFSCICPASRARVSRRRVIPLGRYLASHALRRHVAPRDGIRHAGWAKPDLIVEQRISQR